MKPIAEFIIDSNHQLFEQIKQLGLKPAASIQSVCVSLIEKAYAAKRSGVKISINRSMISHSYITVAAMFARTFESKCSYPAVHSFLNPKYLVVYAGEGRLPTTFKAKALKRLRIKGVFMIPKRLVPITYRTRPGVLAAMLTNELGTSIAFSAKSDDEIFKWERK